MSEQRYYASDDQTTWDNGQLACKTMGGSLVSIYDESEMKRISSLLAYGDYWIGLKRIGQAFVWTDGSSSTYRNWPLGKTSPGFESGECVTINFSEENTKEEKVVLPTFRVRSCNDAGPRFICKIPGKCVISI